MFTDNKVVLVTGGAGSIGSVLVKKIVSGSPNSVRILDSSEYNLWKLKRDLQDNGSESVRLLLGDIRNKERVDFAMKGVDVVFHLAAIKNIYISEYNPFELIDTNIGGLEKIIASALKYKPERFLFISSDKAVNPTSMYGMTKTIGEQLISWADSISKETVFSSLRFGNVQQSSGNVFEIWEEQRRKGLPLTVTDERMERYFFDINECVDFIIRAGYLSVSKGEIFVPNMKEYRVIDMAREISNNIKITGIRKGEKLKEMLMTVEEKKKAKPIDDFSIWVI